MNATTELKNFTSTIKTFHFTIKNPNTGKLINQMIPAVSVEMARKILVMRNDERVLGLIKEIRVS